MKGKITLAECNLNYLIARLIGRELRELVGRPRHCDGVQNCLKRAVKEKELGNANLLIDLEDIAWSWDKREAVSKFLEKNSCREIDEYLGGAVIVYMCSRRYIVLFNEDPEKVLERLSPQISGMLENPEWRRRLKSRSILKWWEGSRPLREALEGLARKIAQCLQGRA